MSSVELLLPGWAVGRIVSSIVLHGVLALIERFHVERLWVDWMVHESREICSVHDLLRYVLLMSFDA